VFSLETEHTVVCYVGGGKWSLQQNCNRGRIQRITL